MALTKGKRTTARARAARAADPRGRYAPPSPAHAAAGEATMPAEPTPSLPTQDDADFGFGAAFKLSKQDKRIIKHSSLMHKVHAAGISKERRPSKTKRRRPQKKLQTDLGELADALPGGDGDEDEWEVASAEEEQVAHDGEAGKSGQVTMKMKMKSLRHRPGAMKRKRAMEGREMERFGKNLAQMSGGGTSGDKWAALRQFIGGTMEKDRAFAKSATVT